MDYKIAQVAHECHRKKVYLTLHELLTDMDIEYNEKQNHTGKNCNGKTPVQRFKDSLHLTNDAGLYVTDSGLKMEPFRLIRDYYIIIQIDERNCLQSLHFL